MPRSRSMSKSKNGFDGEGGSPGSPLKSSSMPPRRWRSTTTRSSSPSSANTGLFTRSRSSSDSSYGESIPPIPGIPLTHINKSQIISPSESNKSWKGDDESASSYKTRRNKGRDITPSPTGSATMPSFDVQQPPTNKFPPRRSSSKRVQVPKNTSSEPTKETITIGPPPVPQRHPRRPPPPKTHTAPYRKQSMPDVKIVMSPTPQARPRPSPADTTPKARPRSVSDSDITIDLASKQVFTFREMPADGTRHLTEQEKNAKWEDLLRKSAKAGGTLHVGPTSGGLGLWSDERSSIAISDKSEVV